MDQTSIYILKLPRPRAAQREGLVRNILEVGPEEQCPSGSGNGSCRNSTSSLETRRVGSRRRSEGRFFKSQTDFIKRIWCLFGSANTQTHVEVALFMLFQLKKLRGSNVKDLPVDPL